MTKSSRTMREPSPMYFCTSSLPDTRMKVQSVWCATARASSVLPVPGGPYSSTPCHGAPVQSATYGSARGASVQTHVPPTLRSQHAVYLHLDNVELALHGRQSDSNSLVIAFRTVQQRSNRARENDT